MGQQEYNNFKQSLKNWKDTHPEEYDCFEAEMNGQDALGLRTKSNWIEHRKLMQMVDSDNAMDWAIDNTTPNEKKKADRKKTDKPFTEIKVFLSE
jgi:hypothetical protein